MCKRSEKMPQEEQQVLQKWFQMLRKEDKERTESKAQVSQVWKKGSELQKGGRLLQGEEGAYLCQ